MSRGLPIRSPISFLRPALAAAAALFLAGALAAQPPRVWIEAEVDPPELPVNAQATLVVRFGYAVDIGSPRLEAPRPRLAEVVPLGGETVRETSRQGLRYRVHEQAWAVLPFASGDMELGVTVHGETPAPLAELGGKRAFSLPARPLVLRVAPARTGSDWLPAYNLQFSGADAAPRPSGPLVVGDVLARRITVEAAGVSGSAIPALHWPSPDAFSIQADPPQSGTRVEGRRVVGWRSETVRLQALRPGRLDLPSPVVNWWSITEDAARQAALPAEAVEVVEAAGPRSIAAEARTMPDSVRAGDHWVLIFALAAVSIACIGLLAWQVRRKIAAAIRRSAARRALRQAAKNGEARAACRHLLAWSGLHSLEECAARARAAGDPKLAAEVMRLEAACYGRAPLSWRSDVLGRRRARL